MYPTRQGMIRRYVPAQIASTYSNPAVGDLVAMVPTLATLPSLAAPKKGKAKAKAELVFPPNPDMGKLELASAQSGENPDVGGIIVSKYMVGNTVNSYFIAPPGEPVPLSLFGTLPDLIDLGDTFMLYLSHQTPGKVVGFAPIDGSYRRRVARLPKMCSNLVAADLDPANPESIFVVLIDELAQGT